jgi:hypothetical protein
LRDVRERRPHRLLGFAVDARRRFVEQQDAGRSGQGARDGDELLLSRRQACAAFAELGVVAPWKVSNEAVRTRRACGARDRLVRQSAAHVDVLAHARREQERLLRHEPDRAAEVPGVDLADRHAVDVDASALRR